MSLGWRLLLADAVVAWTTGVDGLAREVMRAVGRRVDAEVLAPVSPAGGESIGFLGAVDFDRELARLGSTGTGRRGG